MCVAMSPAYSAGAGKQKNLCGPDIIRIFHVPAPGISTFHAIPTRREGGLWYTVPMTEGKESTTEKRYRKLVGKLYWYPKSRWIEDDSSPEKARYITYYSLMQINKLSRMWSRGKFIYQVAQLPDEHNGGEVVVYNWRATRVVSFLKKGKLIEVKDGNTTPPPIENEPY